jgi:hypothetical protein
MFFIAPPAYAAGRYSENRMVAIESFDFSLGIGQRRLALSYLGPEPAMSIVAAETVPAAELEAYNFAFSELELPWRWDAQTFDRLQSIAIDRDFIGAYIEQNQPHLLRVYEKQFLRDLVLSAKARYRQEPQRPAR